MTGLFSSIIYILVYFNVQTVVSFIFVWLNVMKCKRSVCSYRRLQPTSASLMVTLRSHYVVHRKFPYPDV